ncbi:MAG: SIS domain-containing protein [Actinobacteria bacterium]|nr:SIS domain-containing protein [Actinomycetota bacterium]
MIIDDALLNHPDAMALCDSTEMLKAIAQSGQQVRVAKQAVPPVLLDSIKSEQPRTLIIVGMGGSGIAGLIVQALANHRTTIPVIAVNSDLLPSWVGSKDFVISCSASGNTAETLAATATALQRGCRVVAITSPNSKLANLVSDNRADLIEIDPAGRMPRSCLWLLLTPQLIIADALGLVDFKANQIDALANYLDELSVGNGPTAELDSNAAKALALEIAGHVTICWATSPLLAPVAYRFACQLNENANAPAIYGVLPEAAHNQVVSMDGHFLDNTDDLDELFKDRIEDPTITSTLRLVLLRDSQESELAKKTADLVTDLAIDRGMLVTTLTADELEPIQRIAQLTAIIDYASVFVALATGIDPGPVPFIMDLKAGLAGT